MTREVISAQIDGEDPCVRALRLPAGAVEAHLSGCADCREWQRLAHVVTRRARLGGSFLDHDLTPQVMAAVAAAPARWRLRLARRGVLAALALAQLAIAVPLLFLGHGHDAGVHAAHELGSFNLALAIAFAAGAVRPALSAGLSWPCAIAATGLVATAAADLIGGQAVGADEAQHLVALAGAALLVWQSRANDAGTAGPAIVAGEDDDTGMRQGISGAEAVPRPDGLLDHPWGDAARLTAPDIAAQAMPQQADATQVAARSGARRSDSDDHGNRGDHGPAERHDGAPDAALSQCGRAHDKVVA